MTKYLVLVFCAGIALILYGGISRGFDGVTITVLVAAAATGLLGLGIARRFSSGVIGPAQCRDCGRGIAPSSPYCKHCGAPR
jgi:hypothetical protein